MGKKDELEERIRQLGKLSVVRTCKKCKGRGEDEQGYGCLRCDTCGLLCRRCDAAASQCECDLCASEVFKAAILAESVRVRTVPVKARHEDDDWV